MLQRIIDQELIKWKQSSIRKPLLLRGARQVGKTFSVRAFGKTFSDFLEVNLERSPDFRSIFEQDLDPKRIIREISLRTGKKISPGETLLFLDEIQEAPKAVLALRYLYEEIPELHVVSAGSLLEFQIEEVGVPVGRVQFMYMYPMSFAEFLWAKGESMIWKELLQQLPEEPVPEHLHGRLLRLLGEYMSIGGMPEAVRTWIETEDHKACMKVHHEIVSSYQQDFNKYAKRLQIKYVDLIFNELPRFTGKKFMFSRLPGDFRARELRPALDLLEKAHIVHRVFHTAGNGIPLGAEANPDRFKTIFLDIGLGQTLLGNDTAPWIYDAFTCYINKGQVVEAFIGQEQLCYAPSHTKTELYYWHRETIGSSAEVDYLLSENREIYPLEVKSGDGGRKKSLQIFLSERPHTRFGLILSSMNISLSGNIRNYPLYFLYALMKGGLK